ncbi:hypothetical protein EK21DRAFT_87695 [Setomelanomma holmii]|uniref:Uncharacterized protein n=1 Tax=Setomelanomma holmii TaxID=210430 RepID=A0A9P4LQJ6_9PLEO|nr:hypothetical protein EK21DRAFT_87695 [Setomelanomma holmii]
MPSKGSYSSFQKSVVTGAPRCHASPARHQQDEPLSGAAYAIRTLKGLGPQKPGLASATPVEKFSKCVVPAPAVAPQRPAWKFPNVRGGLSGLCFIVTFTQLSSWQHRWKRQAQARAAALEAKQKEAPKRQSNSPSREGSTPEGVGSAVRLSRCEPEVEERVVRWLEQLSRQGSTPVGDGSAAQLPAELNSVGAHAIPTRLPGPKLRITRTFKPRSYRRAQEERTRIRSALKRPGVPTKQPKKFVRFSETITTHTLETVESIHDDLYGSFDRFAPRPVAWKTGTLNAPVLQDPDGGHATIWKSVRENGEVITGFRSAQHRARVYQVQAFYRAQAQEVLHSVTDSHYVEVKQTIRGFYGQRFQSKTETMWSGVLLDEPDAQDALPSYAFGSCTLHTDGDWRYRSEHYQSHDGRSNDLPGRYQCSRRGGCVRFSYGQTCGCEGKWFVRFGTPYNLRIWQTSVVPHFPDACEAKVSRGLAVGSGGDGLTVASLASSVTEPTKVTERIVAPSHPRPSVSCRRKTVYPVVTSRPKTYTSIRRSPSPMGVTLTSSSSDSSTSSHGQAFYDALVQRIQQRIHQQFFGNRTR